MEKKTTKKTTTKKEAENKEKELETKKPSNETFEFSGEYLKAIGRRKTAVAQVRLYKKGKGTIIVNQKKASHYFPSKNYFVLNHFLKIVNVARDYDFSVLVKGGGMSAQVEAVRHGIARCLLVVDEELRAILRTNGFLTRDSRVKERKKPGLLGARKRPQWSKR